MAGYIGSKASVVSSGAERKKTFAITTTTTALTGLVYTPTKVHVFHNGVRLVDGTDFTATNSTSITLTVAAESGDQVVVVSYASFQVADAYTQTEADAEFVAKAGDTMTGPLSVTGTVTAVGNLDILQLTGTGGNAFARFTDSDASSDFSIGADDNSGAGAGAFVFYDRNNTAYRLVLNSSGNVGIGTAAPTQALVVSESSTPTIQIKDGAASGTRVSGRLHIGETDTLGVSIENSTSTYNDNCAMVFKTSPPAGTITERMRIDAVGRVTTPSQPAFHVYNTTNGAFTLAAGAYYPFNAAVSNVGNSFNTSTHGFTAPVDGNYSLDFSTITNSNQHNIHLDFAFSGNSNQGTNYHWSTHSSNWQSLSMSGVYYMSAGVSVRVRNNSFAIGYHGAVWNKFTGYLLG